MEFLARKGKCWEENERDYKVKGVLVKEEMVEEDEERELFYRRLGLYRVFDGKMLFHSLVVFFFFL